MAAEVMEVNRAVVLEVDLVCICPFPELLCEAANPYRLLQVVVMTPKYHFCRSSIILEQKNKVCLLQPPLSAYVSRSFYPSFGLFLPNTVFPL